MRRERLHEHVERGRRAAHRLRPHAERVHGLQQLALERRHLGVGIALADRAEERVLGDGHRLLRRSPHAHADDERRAGIAPGQVHCLADEVDDGLAPRPGEKVLVARHVLAAPALGHEADVDLVAGHDLGVNHAGRVRACVLPVAERVRHDRLAQVALAVPLLDTVVDGVQQEAAGHVHVLPQLDVDDGRARVLAEGQHPLPRDLGVLQDLVDDLHAKGRALRFARIADGALHVLRQEVGRLDGESRDRLGDGRRLDLSHGVPSAAVGGSSARRPVSTRIVVPRPRRRTLCGGPFLSGEKRTC